MDEVGGSRVAESVTGTDSVLGTARLMVCTAHSIFKRAAPVHLVAHKAARVPVRAGRLLVRTNHVGNIQSDGLGRRECELENTESLCVTRGGGGGGGGGILACSIRTGKWGEDVLAVIAKGITGLLGNTAARAAGVVGGTAVSLVRAARGALEWAAAVAATEDCAACLRCQALRTIGTRDAS